jgi:hypothetical protein
MKLLEHLKTDRARQKAKKPLPEKVFPAVAAIVQRFALTSFPGVEDLRLRPVESPRMDRLSLFPLLSEPQFLLTQEIISRFDNPYLIYARSPADITISLLLYRRRPDLTPEMLRLSSLETLWAGGAAPEPGNRPASNGVEREAAD